MGRARTILLVLLVLISRACVLAASAATADPIIRQLVAAVDSDNLATVQTELDQQSSRALGDLQNLDMNRVVTLAACREFARYFGAIPHPTPEQKELLEWLAVQPRLMPTLMTAVSNRDPPRRVLDLLQTLRAEQADRLDDFADLATAMIVVWDKPLPADETNHKPKFDAQRAARLFAYFSNPQTRLRFDPKSFCWQLDVYFTDLRISDDELQWAVNRYSNNFSIGSLYFDVNYDDGAFYQGDEKKISGHEYTLQNILQFGGVCVDQAYFSEQVAKSMGIPACMCTSNGGGAGQAAHAWLGLLNQINNLPAWDFEQGRYKEDLFWSADIVDPQTHEQLTDADVSLLAEFQKTDRSTREASTLLLKLADLLPPDRRFDLYLKEIQISPGNRPAWIALAKLGAKQQFMPAQSQAVNQVVSQFLVQGYPDFTCEILMMISSGQSSAEQVATLDRIAQLFPQRPDLKARIRLRQYDLLATGRQSSQGLDALNDVLTNDLEAGPIVLQALERVEKLMPAQTNLLRLAGVYGQVWPRMPVPDRSSYVYWTPYYVVGKRYMTLLDSLGDCAASDNVRNHLVAVIPEGAALR